MTIRRFFFDLVSCLVLMYQIPGMSSARQGFQGCANIRRVIEEEIELEPERRFIMLVILVAS